MFALPLSANDQHIALVIGNNAYPQSPLLNARADAVAIAQLLEDSLNYQVNLLEDASLSEMEAGLTTLFKRALIFYNVWNSL